MSQAFYHTSAIERPALVVMVVTVYPPLAVTLLRGCEPPRHLFGIIIGYILTMRHPCIGFLPYGIVCRAPLPPLLLGFPMTCCSSLYVHHTAFSKGESVDQGTAKWRRNDEKDSRTENLIAELSAENTPLVEDGQPGPLTERSCAHFLSRKARL